MKPMRPSRAAWLLVALLAYPCLHVVAAGLVIPPSVFFPALVRSLFFVVGCLVVLGCVLQLIRR